MSVERRYGCNLCHNAECHSPLHGIKWRVWRHGPDECRDTCFHAPKTESENHMCERCIRDVRAIAVALKLED